MRFGVVLEYDTENDYWVSHVPSLDNISAWGKTEEEALKNAKEVVLGYLETEAHSRKGKAATDFLIKSLMTQAEYKTLEDGTVFGGIPSCPGAWANEDALERCREVLQEVLEEWVVLKTRDGEVLLEIEKAEFGSFEER